MQVVSIENERSLGATAQYCQERQLPEPSSIEIERTVIVAFGDKTLCKHLLYTASSVGVKVKLLDYVKSAGHRQMVEKLLWFYKSLPVSTLVVKLDGSDVVLTPDASYEGFESRWRKLGGGILFTAESALFYHIGSNNVDCRWVARYIISFVSFNKCCGDALFPQNILCVLLSFIVIGTLLRPQYTDS